MRKHYDILIVGQGLAGSLLAQECVKRGMSIAIIDNHDMQSASRVAAGIINPVTGHRLNITEQFAQFSTVATASYLALETLLKTQFYTPIIQDRLLKNKGQHDYYLQRLTEPEYESVLGNYRARADNYKQAQFGSVDIKQSAIVNTQALLSASQDYLSYKAKVMVTQLDYQELIFNADNIRYADIEASSIVFCEGYQARNNPWLQDLPFKLAKGEIVELELDAPLNSFLNWGNWLIPGKCDNRARLGASYEWNDLSLQASGNAKLIESLQNHTTIHAKTLGTSVGIRPTTRQRIPFIGRISQLQNAYCFNGFGSKGCLLIPYYTQLMCDHLLKQTPLDEALNQWL